MTPTKIDSRQIKNVAALSGIGSAANATLDTILSDINTIFADATYLPTPSVLMTRDSHANTEVNNLIEGFTPTVTSGTITTLTVASTYTQQFTGTANQTVSLPAANTLYLGQQFYVTNRSTGTLTVNDGSGGLVQTMASNTQALLTVTNIGSVAGSWDSAYTSSNALNNPMTTLGDIIVGGTGGTPQRLGVGNNGEVLTANSSAPDGLEWAYPNPNVVTVNTSTNYPITATNDIILCNSAAVTLTLPDATVAANRKRYTIKKTDFNLSNTVTIDTTSSQTIANGDAVYGSGTVMSYTQGETWVIFSDGANWQVESHTSKSTPNIFTPSLTGGGFSPSGWVISSWRDGKWLHVQGLITVNAAGNSGNPVLETAFGGVNGNVSIDIGAGGILNGGPQTVGSYATNGGPLGHAQGEIVAGSGVSSTVVWFGSTVIQPGNPSALAQTTGAQMSSAANTNITVNFKVPIVGWLD